MIIGLVGRIGCGKSTLANHLKEKHNWEVINLDVINHQVLNREVDEIKKAFGSWVCEVSSEEFTPACVHQLVNRKRLGDVVFNNKHALKELERILYEPNLTLIMRTLCQIGLKENIILDGITLFKLKLEKLCTHIIEVVTPYQVARDRVISRSGYIAEKFHQVWIQQKEMIPKELVTLTIPGNYPSIDEYLKEGVSALSKISVL